LHRGTDISGAGATTHNADEVRGKQAAGTSADSSLKDMFEAKIKAEWEAIKNKDKKAYGDLLADDYQASKSMAGANALKSKF